MSEDYEMNESSIYNKNYLGKSLNLPNLPFKSSNVFRNKYNNKLHSSISFNIHMKEAERLERQDREEINEIKEAKKKEKLREALRKEISNRLRIHKVSKSGTIVKNRSNHYQHLFNDTPHFGKHKNKIATNFFPINEIESGLNNEQTNHDYKKLENAYPKNNCSIRINRNENDNNTSNNLHNNPNLSLGNSKCIININPSNQFNEYQMKNRQMNNTHINPSFIQSKNFSNKKKFLPIIKDPKLLGCSIRINRSNILTKRFYSNADANQKDLQTIKQNKCRRNNSLLRKRIPNQELNLFHRSKKRRETPFEDYKNRRSNQLTRNRYLLTSVNEINNSELNSKDFNDVNSFPALPESFKIEKEKFHYAKNSVPFYKSKEDPKIYLNNNISNDDSLNHFNNNYVKRSIFIIPLNPTLKFTLNCPTSNINIVKRRNKNLLKYSLSEKKLLKKLEFKFYPYSARENDTKKNTEDYMHKYKSLFLKNQKCQNDFFQNKNIVNRHKLRNSPCSNINIYPKINKLGSIEYKERIPSNRKASQLNQKNELKENSIGIFKKRPTNGKLKNNVMNSNIEIQWIRKAQNIPRISLNISKHEFLKETLDMNSSYFNNNSKSAEEYQCKMRIYKKIRNNNIQINTNQLRNSYLNNYYDKFNNSQSNNLLNNDIYTNIQSNQKENDFEICGMHKNSNNPTEKQELVKFLRNRKNFDWKRLRNSLITEKFIDNSFCPCSQYKNLEESNINCLIENQQKSYLRNFYRSKCENNLSEQDSVNFYNPFNENVNNSKIENSVENFSYLPIRNQNKFSKNSMIKD